MLFCFPNEVAIVRLMGSEANWIGFSSLKTARLSERARWSGTQDYEAAFTVDRGLAYYQRSLGCIALVGHNLTPAATISVVGSLFRAAKTSHVPLTYEPNSGLYGLGRMTAAPAALNGAWLAVGDAIMLKGQSDSDQNGQYRVTTVGTGTNGVWDRTSTETPASTTFTASGPARTCTAAEAEKLPGLAFLANADGYTNSRYLSITVSDEDAMNEDGYIELAYLWISDAWAPLNGPSYSWSLGYEDPSVVETSIGGIDYFDPRPKYRVLRFGLDHLMSDEWATQGLALSRDLGITEPLLFVMSTTDSNLGERVSFMGRLRTLNPIENPDPLRYASAFEVKEIVA